MHAHTVLCGDLYAACVDARGTVFWDHSGFCCKLLCRDFGSCNACRRLFICRLLLCDLVLHILSMCFNFLCLKSSVSCCGSHYNRLVWLCILGRSYVWLYLFHCCISMGHYDLLHWLYWLQTDLLGQILLLGLLSHLWVAHIDCRWWSYRLWGRNGVLYLCQSVELVGLTLRCHF